MPPLNCISLYKQNDKNETNKRNTNRKQRKPKTNANKQGVMSKYRGKDICKRALLYYGFEKQNFAKWPKVRGHTTAT